MGLKIRDRNGVRRVDENTLRRELNIPKTQNMVIEQGDGRVRTLRNDDSIDTDRDIIEMIPVIKQGFLMNRERVVEDCLTLGNAFSVEVDSDLQWTIIEDFLTPLAYSPDFIPVLMKIPPDYPLTPPGLGHYNIYVREGLRRDDGKMIDHYYRSAVHCTKGCCDLSSKGWYWWCFEEIRWDPRINDLLSIARALYVCMDKV